MIEYRAELSPAVLPAGAYADVLALQRRLSHPQARTVLVRKRTVTREKGE